MNDEYISRVEAEEAIEEYCCRRCKEYSEVEGGCVSHAQHCEHLSGEEILKPVKSADVQPVKRGRWIDCTFYDPCEKSWEQDFEFECSNCGHKIYNKPNDNNLFCGHCSARMDGDTECQ